MFKSKIIPCSCSLFACSHIFIILSSCIVESHQDMFNYRVMEVIDDLPVPNDMDRYLASLKRIVHFIDGHKYYVGVDLCFSIYLINVHLRGVLQWESSVLSQERRNLIVQLVETNKYIINRFVRISKEQTHSNKVPNILVQMFNIQDNTVTWPNFNPLRKFNTELLNETKFYTRKELEVIYYKWSKYKKTVFGYKEGYQTLEKCLKLLAENPYNNFTEFIHCQMPYTCLEYLGVGFDYGYEIAHRMLLLLAARYWRHCLITSNDKGAIDKLCVIMYNELEYMANHEFGLPDLFLDHITLCSFEGHAQFLRRSWIEELLEFQTRFGCFNLTRPSASNSLLVAIFQNISDKGDIMVWEESCNAHITGVAGVVLATAIGFITDIAATKPSTCVDCDSDFE